MAIVLFRHGQPYVFEAAQPVRFTPLGEWEARGKDGHFIAKRSRKPLSPATIATFHRLAARYAGKPYDFTFEWSDERMYCSELVCKLYKGAHITLAPLARLGSFDLRDPLVRKIVKQRYGNHVPLDEPVVTPAALFNSPLLVTVADERASRTR